MVTIKLRKVSDEPDNKIFKVLIYFEGKLIEERLITVTLNYEITEKLENILKSCLEISQAIK
jgi:hypothetical protein